MKDFRFECAQQKLRENYRKRSWEFEHMLSDFTLSSKERDWLPALGLNICCYERQLSEVSDEWRVESFNNLKRI